MAPLTQQQREQRLDEVLASYLQALKEGAAPGRQELLDSHPELANELADFFADQDRFDYLAAPLRVLVPSASRLGNLRNFGDYEIIEEIARGGMGVVFKAWQKSLGRVVALKMLLAGPWASAADLQRFRAEAESAAQLDHPNIVPIHEVGTHDGHPYLSMKLVEGGSLAQRLAASGYRPSAREAAALLASVADAIHYAHQRGILHRDLKPANILLGMQNAECRMQNERQDPAALRILHSAFCIPMVTDFGLAKRATRPGRSEGMASRRPLSAVPTLPYPQVRTHTGAIIGTPGYMAPEQASGSPAAVTTAADVYGLGAILYEMLTGRPPFRGDTPLDTVRLVLEQEPSRPSVHNPSVSRDLETICLKCLHKQPARRYASARELADDLRRFLKGEPILARPVGPLERAWRLARRQPAIAALTLALVATLLVGVSGVIALWLRAEDIAQQAKEHARTAERERDEAKAAREEADKNRREAEHHLADAERSFRMAHQAVHDYCRRVSEELRDTPSLQPLRKALLQDALTYYKSFLERRGNDPKLRREQADTYQSMARVINAIGTRAEARDAYEHALETYRDLQRNAPDDADLLRRLGGLLNDSATFQDKTEKVVARLEEARILYDNYLARPPEDHKDAKTDWDMRAGLGLTLSNLGWAEQQRGRLRQARDWYQQARRMQEQLLKEEPKNRFIQSSLAATLSNYAALRGREFGGRDEAVTSLEEVCRLRQELARSGDAGARADLATALQNLFNALRTVGRQTDAKKTCQQAYLLRQKLARDHPLVRRYQSDLASSHRLMGFLDRADKRLPQALDHHQTARDIQEKLLRLDPGSPGLRRELSWSYFNVAAIHGALDHRPEELKSYEQARKLQEGLVRLDPDNLEYREDLVRTLNNLSWNRMAMNHPEEAPPLLHEAIDHARLAVRRAGGILSYRMMLSHALATLVEAELRLGHTNSAAELLRERRKLWPGDPEEQFRVAHDLMATAAKVGGGKAELTPTQRDERDTDVKEALDALRQAVSCGFRDAARLKKDKTFDPLRSNETFRDLVGDLEKQSPQPKKQRSGPPEPK